MTWTIVSDLPMKEYLNNRILDTTKFNNHGELIGSVNPFHQYVSIYADNGQIEIPITNDSLNRFTAIKIQALINPNNIIRRFNIIEGWMSFAFFIESNSCLKASIYDGQQWCDFDSGMKKIPVNTWSRVAFEYDGVSYAKIVLNGVTVGSRSDMPTGMMQPQQVITIGHWPRGDGRYTFLGNIGHIRIEKRDYEDFWRDAMITAFCNRHLSREQMSAKAELEFILANLNPKDQEQLKICAQKQSQRICKWLRQFRALSPRGQYAIQRLGIQLREAWCCGADKRNIQKILLSFFRSLKLKSSSEKKELFTALVQEFFDIAYMCEQNRKPFDRIIELNHILFPEFDQWELALREIIDAI